MLNFRLSLLESIFGLYMLLFLFIFLFGFYENELDKSFMKKATITVVSKEDLGKVVSAKTYDGFFESTRTEIMTEKAGFTVGKLITPAAGNMELRHSKATLGTETINLDEICQGTTCFKYKNLMLSSR
ncbi:hypothetical protein [Acerihabitans arboris]|uniref:Uncharacterized protein n=1 Tax=Acerihabitans arboris TaxID=2691583 RepID=A0A845SLX9_9GAMM|nr:hypothetical protein [Acerihabitans arboris]NDL64237.1 hypothetical protein [Acerihabitans arboris]